MAKPGDVILFSDVRAFLWYASELASEEPAALLRPAAVATLAEGAPWRLAASGSLPAPSDALAGRAEARRGAVLAEEVVLEGKGRKKERLPVTGAAEYSALIQAVPLVPARTDGEVTLLVESDRLEEVLDAVATSGRQLSGVAISSTDDGRSLVRIGDPPWYLIERGGLGGDAKFFRQVPKKRVYVEWGWRHPQEALLKEPGDPSAVLLVVRSGHSEARRGPWEGAGAGGGRWSEVDVESDRASPAPGPDDIRHELRLAKAKAGEDAELWMVGGDAERAVVEAVSGVPEDDLRFVQAADLDADGGRLLVLRESAGGRRGPRVIPRGRGTYSRVHGSRGLYVPAGRRLTPDLPPHVYERILVVSPGEVAIVDEDADGLFVSKVAESSFRPVREILEHVRPASGQAPATALQEPWSIGAFGPDAESAEARPMKPKARGEGDDEALRELLEPGEAEARPEAGPRAPGGVDEAAAGIAAAALASGDDVAKEERAALDRMFKALPPAVQQRIDAAVQHAIAEGARRKRRRNAGQRDAARLRRMVLKALVESGEVKPPSPSKKGPPRRKPSAGAEDAIAPLEVRALDDPDDAGAWIELAEAYLGSGNAEEAAKAAEMAAWAGAAGAWTAMAKADRDYARADEFRRKAPTLPPLEFAKTAQAVIDGLGRDERKRKRWLVRMAVAAASGDQLALEQERDAIMAELASRGMQEHELPSLVRRRLLQRFSAAEASAESSGSMRDMIEDMLELGGKIRDKDAAAEILGDAALYLASTGSAGRGAEVAAGVVESMSGAKKKDRASARGAPTGWHSGAGGLAKAGAAMELAESGSGDRAFKAALAISRDYAETYELGTAAQKFLEAFAEAGMRKGDAPVDELMGLVARLSPAAARARGAAQPRIVDLAGYLARLLEDLADEVRIEVDVVRRLGIVDDLAGMAREILAADGLRSLEYEGAAIFMSKVAESLTADDAEALLAAAAGIDAYNNYTAKFLFKPALSALDDPVGRAERFIADHLAGRPAFDATLVRTGAAIAAADAQSKDAKAALARAVGDLSAAEEGESEEQERNRMYVLQDALKAIPAAFSEDRRAGMALARRAFDAAADGSFESIGFAAMVMSRAAQAAAALGESSEAQDMAVRVIGVLVALDAENGDRAGRYAKSYVRHYVSMAAADAAEVIGDKELAARVAQRIVDGARLSLQAATRNDVGFGAKSLADASKILSMAGDARGAEALMREALEALKAMPPGTTGDPFDASLDLVDAGAALVGTARYEAARGIISTIGEHVDKAASYSLTSAVDAATEAARKFLREEGPFKEALARWTGEDERRIRDRILSQAPLRDGGK